MENHKKTLKEITQVGETRYIFYRRERRLIIETQSTLFEYRGEEASKRWEEVN